LTNKAAVDLRSVDAAFPAFDEYVSARAEVTAHALDGTVRRD
jgi:hypothetical protein